MNARYTMTSCWTKRGDQVTRLVCLVVLVLGLNVTTVWARDYSTSKITKVVMLGSGTPMPDPNRRGPAIAVVVNDTPYIVDAGEGIWRATGAAGPMFGGPIDALAPPKLTKVFLTHLHSDHVTGLPAIILHPWQFGRTQPVDIYGPPGTERMVEHLLEAYREDIYQRLHGVSQNSAMGWQARGHDLLGPGKVFEDANVKVLAFRTQHATWPLTFAYRFETPDRTVAISGDTVPTQGVIDAAQDADILLHEVIGLDDRDKAPWGDTSKQGKPVDVGDISRFFHTTTKELAEIAIKAKPKLLVLYHEQNWSDPYEPQALVEEIHRFGYDGRVLSAQDLDVY